MRAATSLDIFNPATHVEDIESVQLSAQAVSYHDAVVHGQQLEEADAHRGASAEASRKHRLTHVQAVGLALFTADDEEAVRLLVGRMAVRGVSRAWCGWLEHPGVHGSGRGNVLIRDGGSYRFENLVMPADLASLHHFVTGTRTVPVPPLPVVPPKDYSGGIACFGGGAWRHMDDVMELDTESVYTRRRRDRQ